MVSEEVEAAQRVLAADRTVAALGLAAIAAVPLHDERQDPVGALVVASMRPWNGVSGLREVLDVAAGRMSMELELERAREQGRAKGLQDSLTGMPNRLLFNDRLETTIKEAQRTGEMFAVLFDLDRFKTINDSLGHGVGDEVLVAAAKRLRAAVRGSDTVSRYAGDEFTLILRHIVEGVIYSRKLVRMEQKAAIARRNGKRGGSLPIGKRSENKGWDNPTLMADDKPQKPYSRSQNEEIANALLSELRTATDAYNAAAAEAGWPQCQRLSKARESALKARLAECGGIEGWLAALAKARASPHLCGQNDRGWTASFDFLTQASSFAKLMEGNYDPRPRHQRTPQGTQRPDAAIEQISRLAGIGYTPGHGRGAIWKKPHRHKASALPMKTIFRRSGV